MQMAVETGAIRKTGRNRFYLYAWVCATLIVFVGFAQTYFLKSLFEVPPLYPLLHVHGFVMTSWFLLFGAQTWLVGAHRTDVHRKLGVFGVLLASTILVVGATVVIINAREGRVPPAAPVPVIVLMSFLNLLVFGVLVAAAIFYRGRSEFHKRLMLLATLNLLSAAISRIPLDLIATGGLLGVFGPLDLIIVACAVYDTVRHRRLHPAFAWGVPFSILWPGVGIVLGGSSTWGAITSWLVGNGT
jgi:hypothetical protein